MYIRSTREAHAGNQFKDPRVHELNNGKPVSFASTGTAQVSAAVGEHLLDAYDVFEETDADDEGEQGEADTADVDAAEDDTTSEDDN